PGAARRPPRVAAAPRRLLPPPPAELRAPGHALGRGLRGPAADGARGAAGARPPRRRPRRLVSRVRIALAGLGAAARRIHLPAYRGLRDLEVVGGADPAVREGALPFPVFASTEAMLDAVRPDVLAVLTPPDTHVALALLGLR